MWFNPMISWLLRSPIHAMLSKNLILVSVTGKKSGKVITFPTNYLQDKNTLWLVSWRDRNWWRNLRGGAKASILLAGQSHEGTGQVIEDEQEVAQGLQDYYQKAPQSAKYVNIKLDERQMPIQAECERAAQKMVLVRIDL